MPLVKSALEAAILAAFKKAFNYTDNPAQAQKAAAADLATAIDTFVRSASVTVAPGIIVSAPPPSGIGATTGPGTGTLA